MGVRKFQRRPFIYDVGVAVFLDIVRVVPERLHKIVFILGGKHAVLKIPTYEMIFGREFCAYFIVRSCVHHINNARHLNCVYSVYQAFQNTRLPVSNTVYSKSVWFSLWGQVNLLSNFLFTFNIYRTYIETNLTYLQKQSVGICGNKYEKWNSQEITYQAIAITDSCRRYMWLPAFTYIVAIRYRTGSLWDAILVKIFNTEVRWK